MDLDNIKMTSPPSPSWSLQVDHVDRWAYIDSLFSEEECDRIIGIANNFALYKGTTFGGGGDSVRNSNITFIHPSPEINWVYERLTSGIVDLNSRFFKFDLWGFNESLQFTEYNAPGGHYGKHIDKTTNSIIRKLSIVVQLTKPDTYEGGDFEYYDSDKPEILSRKRGTLLAFPSYALHQVTPVTKGKRNSLVGWISGVPFK